MQHGCCARQPRLRCRGQRTRIFPSAICGAPSRAGRRCCKLLKCCPSWCALGVVWHSWALLPCAPLNQLERIEACRSRFSPALAIRDVAGCGVGRTTRREPAASERIPTRRSNGELCPGLAESAIPPPQHEPALRPAPPAAAL